MSDLKEQILGKKNLHSYYYPRGDTKKKMIHDDDCTFCHYEEEVLEAMEEYAIEMVKQANGADKTQEKALHKHIVSKQSGLFICPNCKGNQTYANAALTNWKCMDCKSEWGKK